MKIDRSSLIKSVQERKRMASSRNVSGLKVDKRTAPYLNRARFVEQ